MRRSIAVVTLFGLAAGVFLAAGSAPLSETSFSQPRVSYAQLPLSFEPNRGQTADGVDYLARGRGYTLFLTPTEAVLSLPMPAKDEKRKAKTEDRLPALSGRGAPHPPGQVAGDVPAGRGSDRAIKGDEKRGASSGHGFTSPERSRRNRAITGDKYDGASAPEVTTRTAIRMEIVGANPEATVSGQDALPGKRNYLFGDDPEKWLRNIPTYRRVRYQEVYPGIDLAYYGTQGGQLEYDFVVKPGADPNAIRLKFNGAEDVPLDVSLDDAGNLHIETPGGEVIQHAPVIYQEVDGERISIEGGYTLLADNRIAFEVGNYDPSLPLVLDPVVLSYSTFLGGSGIGGDGAEDMTIDSQGNAYIVGFASSTDFPTVDPIQASCSTFDVGCGFLTKLDPTGSFIIYSTFIGGSDWDIPRTVAVDENQNVYIAGSTKSSDFPVVTNPLEGGAFGNPVCAVGIHGWSGFHAKIDSSGTALIYSECISNAGVIRIMRDSVGNIYLAGGVDSPDFPLVNPIQADFTSCPPETSCADAFVARLNSTATLITFSTFFGSVGGGDGVRGLDVDASGKIYIAGTTSTKFFPIANAVQPSLDDSDCRLDSDGSEITCYSDMYIAKMDPANSTLDYSTYLGGPRTDRATDLAVTPSGEAIVVGYTEGDSSRGENSNSEPVVAKISSDGSSLLFYKPLSESNTPYSVRAEEVALDSEDNIYITGPASPGFPTRLPLDCAVGCDRGIFVMKLSPDGTAMFFSAKLGGGTEQAEGIAVDAAGNVYVAGTHASPDYPTTPSALFTSPPGPSPSFVAKILVPTIPGLSSISPSSVVVGTGSFTLTVTGFEFQTDSIVRWNGVDRPTTFVSKTQLTAAIPGSDIPTAGANQITVFNPTPDSLDSNIVELTVENTLPVIGSLVPDNVAGGDPGFVLTVNGTEFVDTSVVRWNDSDRLTFFLSETQLGAAITTDDITLAGMAEVTVFTPTPGGGLSNAATFTITGNPVPTVSAVSPGSAVADGPGFTLTVNGSSFFDGAVVRWNGSDRTTTFVSDTQLTAQILATDLIVVGSVSVQVLNPLPGGGLSNSVSFTVGNRIPILNTVSPPDVMVGSGSVAITLNGADFVPGAWAHLRSKLWSLNRTATFMSSGQLTFTLESSRFTQHLQIWISVINPEPGSASSGEVLFRVLNPVPVLSSLSPPSVLAESPGFTLKLLGSGYNSSSVVRWDGVNRARTFIGDGELQISISSSELAMTGTAEVQVFSPSPGGGLTNTLIFSIVNPVPAITSVVPDSVAAGGPDFLLTVNGSGYNSASVVRWKGTDKNTFFVNQTQLVGSIPAADIAAGGPATVTVFNSTPGGGTSNGMTFTITAPSNPVPALTTLSPANMDAGGGDFTLTVNGSNFINGATVRWDGGDRATTYVNASQLTATIPAGDILTGDTATITVFNPAPGGGASGGMSFTIDEFVSGPASGQPTSATVTAGQAANFLFTITPSGSFDQPVSFSCSGLPAKSSCSFSPAQITPGSNPTDVALTINTTANGSALPIMRITPPATPLATPLPSVPLGLLLLALLLGLLMTGTAVLRAQRTLRLRPHLALVCLLLLGLAATACGGGTPPPLNNGTPTGTFIVTVSATSGNLTQTLNFTLTVQ